MEFTFVGIDHVQLAAPAASETEARRFFGDVLGWVELEKPEHLQKRGGLWFQCGAQQVHIGIQNEFVPARKAHPAFFVRNLDALRVHVEAKGFQPVDDEPLPGAKRFYLFDPFGNRLEFLEWLQR
jgi:catechol 2,3-dioxygenase-like lactoylglutathione lyase family enzyme